MTHSFIIDNPRQMHIIAEVVANKLLSGDVVVLTGPLGAGKTTFTQGLGVALGISDAITSPTFVVCRRHKPGAAGIGLVHVDAYRLSSADDLFDLDLDALTNEIAVIEWGAHFVQSLTDDWLEIFISRDEPHFMNSVKESELLNQPQIEESDNRMVRFKAHGDRWNSVCADIEDELILQRKVDFL